MAEPCPRLPAIGVLLAATVVGAPLPAAAAERPWIEVRSSHFVVVSDGNEKAARKVAWQFEQIHSLVPRLWPWARVNLSRPLLVIAARNEGSMRALLPEYWERKDAIHPAAMLVSGRDRHYIAVQADVEMRGDEVRVNPYRMAYWSYVLLVLEQSFEQDLPLWFSRGISEVFSNTIVRDDDVELGRVIPWQLRTLREEEFLPFAKLRAIDRSSPYHTNRDKRNVFDANSWALVHYLMFGDDGAHRAQLNRFSGLLQAGASLDQATKEAFPDLPALDRAAELYARRLAFGFVRLKIDLEVKQEGFATRPLAEAEAAAARAGFHVAMKRPAEARALLDAGKKADPASPLILEVEGLLAELEDREEDAKAAYARAAAQEGASYYALYRHAQNLHRASPDPGTLARIEAVLGRVIARNPNYSYGYSYLAETMAALGKAAEAEGLARRAITLDPTVAYHQVALARVLLALQKPDDARRAAEKGLSLSRSPSDQSNARTMLEFLARAPGRGPAGQAMTAEPPVDAQALTACAGGDAAACAKVTPFYEKRCGDDEALACAFLASLHERGLGLPRDFERAATFYLMACNLGEKKACLAQAAMQSEGKGLPRDAAAARATAEKLCAEGLPEGCTFLAALHLRKGTAKDLARARELLAQACGAGDASACRMAKSLPKP